MLADGAVRNVQRSACSSVSVLFHQCLHLFSRRPLDLFGSHLSLFMRALFAYDTFHLLLLTASANIIEITRSDFFAGVTHLFFRQEIRVERLAVKIRFSLSVAIRTQEMEVRQQAVERISIDMIDVKC